MPIRSGPVTPLESLPIEERRAMPADCQAHWYRLAAGLAVDAGCLNALDVGAGHGLGMDILREHGLQTAGIDPLPLRADILHRDISEVCDGGYDLVIACDVIEHVEADVWFLIDLLRVARVGVFFSTPNYAFSKCRNPHHVREYTAGELLELLEDAEAPEPRLWTSGLEREAWPIREPAEAVNNFGVWLSCAS